MTVAAALPSHRAAGAAAALPAIAGYRVHRLLGHGRTAAVYLAEHRQRGGLLALKVPHSPPAGARSGGRRFAAECEMLASIRHSHVVGVLEHRQDGPAFLAMEYLDGGTLRQCMRARMPPRAAVGLLRQAARGLAALHGAGIVHRDVKPENFLLRGPGTVVLADLGVAAREGDATARVAVGHSVGTPRYAAPEQTAGGPPSPAADVYSLGILFHELLCGRPPFAARTPLEAVAQHLVAPVPRLPAALASYQFLIERLLAKHPTCRPADAAAVLREIEWMAPCPADGFEND